MTDCYHKLKRQARQDGVAWADVQALASELRQHDRDARERANEIRRESWERMVPRTCWPFWRHGWRVRYPKAFEGGDWRNIRGFDVLAAGMALAYPELGNGDACENLYNELLKPYRRAKAPERLYREAIELLASGATSQPEAEPIPF